MIGLVWTVLQGYISNQESRNEFVRAENRKLDIQIKEIASLRAEIDGLRARQRAVEDLQADRNLPVYLIDEVAKQVPEGIYLRGIKQEDRRVNVSGWAASNERVSEFLRNLQNNSRVLERPELIEIKVAGAGPQGINRRVFEFSLNFSLKQTPERALMQAQPGAKSTLVPTSPVPTAVQTTPNLKSSAAK
jgi:type IV pilus assembly protein PilN